MASRSLEAVFLLAFIASAAAFQYGDIRLADTLSTKPDLGRLEVYSRGNWHSICYDIDNEKIGFAKVACAQLGYKSWKVIGTAEKLGFTRGIESALLYYVHCPNKKDPRNAPLHILRCDNLKESPSGHECPPANHIVLECDDASPLEEDPYDTMVGFYNDTLVDIINDTTADFYGAMDENEFADFFDISEDPQSVSSGLAKVYVNGAWGPVCNMNGTAAESFCRQLGFTNVSKVEEVEVKWTEGEQPAEVLDSFNCVGESHSCLRECFDYPALSAPVNCNGRFSEVTCMFDELITNDYGTKSACTASSAGVVAASVVGSLVFVVIVVTIATVLACFLLQGCRWRGKKLLITETAGGAKYKSF